MNEAVLNFLETNRPQWSASVTRTGVIVDLVNMEDETPETLSEFNKKANTFIVNFNGKAIRSIANIYASLATESTVELQDMEYNQYRGTVISKNATNIVIRLDSGSTVQCPSSAPKPRGDNNTVNICPIKLTHYRGI